MKYFGSLKMGEKFAWLRLAFFACLKFNIKSQKNLFGVEQKKNFFTVYKQYKK